MNKTTKLLTGIAAAGMLGLWATSADAITAYPDYPVSGDAPLGVQGDYAPGFEGGSWAAAGAGYTQAYFTPEQLFGRPVRIGELQSISWWTKKETGGNSQDWFMNIYTDPFDGSPGAGWYGNRIGAEPMYSESLNAPAGEWNQWQTDEGADNRLRFFDSSEGYFGGYADTFLQDLTANEIYIAEGDLSSFEYEEQYVRFFTLGTGTGWAEGFTGQLDGLRIELDDHRFAEVNFEASSAIPEPMTAGLGMLAFGGLAGYLSRRRRPTQR